MDWLTSPTWSLPSVIIANIWIGVPFNLVLLYSGLQAIPRELYEAAALDGAERLAAVPPRHLAAAAARLRDHAAARAGLHAQGLRHHLDHDAGRPGRIRPTTFATWSYQLGFGNMLPEFGLGAAVGNLLVDHGPDRGAGLHPGPEEAAGVMTTHLTKRPAPRSRRRGPVKTAVGVLLTAIMLFPVYWMINESFTPDQDMRKSPPNLLPIDGTLDGYRR